MCHRELVPAPVAPEPVHRVEHVQQAQVVVNRQAIPGGGAHVFKRDVGLRPVHELHAALLPHKGTHQPFAAALALQVFDEGEHRAFAAIERHEIHKVKQAWLGQLAQFGVHEAAPQADTHIGVCLLDGLGDAQRAIDGAGEGHRQQHELRLVLGHRGQGQRRQRLVHQVGRSGQRLGQRVKCRLGGGQAFSVAHEFKTLIHRALQHIGQVVQVERGQVPGPIGAAQCTKGPAQRVAGFFVVIRVQR